jgi:hypothetical protein
MCNSYDSSQVARELTELVTKFKGIEVKAGRFEKISDTPGITDYVYKTSSDNGLTWSQETSMGQARVSSNGTSTFAVTGLTTGVARLIRIAAVNGDGTGPYSDDVFATTRGARQMRVQVLDADGGPVVGGAITWEMIPRTSWSTKTYGLTADGVIDFPAAPAGTVKITLANGRLSDGSTVSGQWTTQIGFSSTVVRIPERPLSSHNVLVKIPNGMGIANVSVQLNSTYLTSSATVGDFTFRRNTSATSGLTNSAGKFYFTGYLQDYWWADGPSVTATYDDGVITQQISENITSESTVVELDYAPWIEATGSAFTGSTGAAIPVTLALETVDDLSRSKSGISTPSQAGVGVTLVQSGAKNAAACGKKGAKSQLTGKTNSAGKVTLKVCGIKSGTYTIKTSGALPSGTVNVRVAGAPSTPVTSATVASNAVGQIRSSWNAPAYLGGAPILQYKIVATAPGAKTVTKINKATVNKSGAVTKAAATSMTLTGLVNAKTYTVKIYAITKFGTSDPVTITVPVA